MKILILGGTGAMGTPLVSLLANNHSLVVTTRSKKENKNNVTYLQGNAKEDSFFIELMSKSYDVIIDFMVYSTNEFKKRVPAFLNHTGQYFFFSSSRCYADSETRITEESPRLVDVCKDEEYIALDEYGMAKGREENFLLESGKSNWTIIRPYITYNINRLQLGVYEKEDWLRHALEDKTIIFPKDIASKKTSLTYGPDVAGAIEKLIGNDKAYGQAFHITTRESHTWGEILSFYSKKLEDLTGKKMKIKLIDTSDALMPVCNKWQIIYDRLYNREFNNSKIESAIGKYEFTGTFWGLSKCLEEFICQPTWLGMNVLYESWSDRQCGEWTPLWDIPGKRAKLKYLKNRLLG